MKAIVIIERAGSNWCAYAPDLESSVIATARTRTGVIRRFRSALRFYLEYLRDHGREVPNITELEVHEIVPLAEAEAA